MVLNVQIKMKTRIYEAPAVKGLNAINQRYVNIFFSSIVTDLNNISSLEAVHCVGETSN